DTDERKIGLSRKRVEWAEDHEVPEDEAASSGNGSASSKPATELKGGIGSDSGPLIKPKVEEAAAED
ncbi:MAG: 30S ribosomal protein S1, partial [Planctomycetes bacterium]|nr:30S ribosomal protein S1 [Planctomycetota bacterium]